MYTFSILIQALSLPLTNICFTLKMIMGSHAEPFTVENMLGLVFVCVGFLVYTGLGMADGFMVAQVSRLARLSLIDALI